MSNKPTSKKLTIGMAHYADYDGVYFTIQSIRLNNPHLMDAIEFVIVDNSPTMAEAGAIKDLVSHINHCPTGETAKYVPFASPGGTSPSRNEIFKQASGEIVLAMDCHVLLWPGALESLLRYYEEHPDCPDLIQGPMFYDSLSTFTTHFNPIWRSEMWGVWSTAYQCSCGKFNFSIREKIQESQAQAVTLDMAMLDIWECPHCKKAMPNIPWVAHENAYKEMGFREIIQDSDDAFPIPGQGLGLFSARKDKWLGFHPLARQFGGEELCVHESYRQAGHQALCLPSLKWLHRFGRPAGVKYPLARWAKVRNYVLWFQQLGMDLSPIREHFVATGLMGENAWQALAQNPDGLEAEPSNSGCSTCPGAAPAQLPVFDSIDPLFVDVERRPRDLNEHMAVLRTYASKCETATEMTARRESTIAILAGKPKSLTSYSTEVDGYTLKAVELVKESTGWNRQDFVMGQIIPDLQPVDMLFIDTWHRYAHLRAELMTYHQRVKRFIVLHDTVEYGAQGDDGGPGLMQALMEFMLTFPQWKVIRQHNNQYGLTILGCQEQDYPQGPGTELHEILDELGIKPSITCECNERMTIMNDWGPQGCRENKDTIVGWMRDGQVKWGWRERLVAAAKAVANGTAFQIIKRNPLDIFPGLVDYSIDRAEEKAKIKAELEAATNPVVDPETLGDLDAEDMEIDETADVLDPLPEAVIDEIVRDGIEDEDEEEEGGDADDQ